jgi:succinoglycan biosynthesis transport protein ExoP
VELAVTPQQQSFSSTWTKGRNQVLRYLDIMRKRWWLVLLTTAIGACLAAWYVSQMPPAYRSTGRLMVSGQIRLNEGAVYSEELFNFFGTQIELMQSVEVRKRALARVQALHPELPPEKVILAVGQVPKASIFTMQVTGETPAFTQAYLDACMDEYIATKKEMRSQKSESTTTAIADELVRLEKEMQSDEDEMHEFQKENNIGFLHEEGNSAAVYLAQLNRQMADFKTEYNLLQLLDLDQNLDRGQQNAGSANGANATGTRPDSAFVNFGPLAEYQKARQQLQVLEAQREDFAHYLRPKHPTMVALDEQINLAKRLIGAFRDQSVEALKNRREAIRLEIQNLDTVIKEWEAKALDLSHRIAEFDKIKSKSERTKAEYDRLLTSLRSVDVTKNVDQDTISILERATPAYSVKPGLEKIMAAGIAAGLLLGLGILIIMDKLDDRIRSFMEFRSHFPEHVMGQIPREKLEGESQLVSARDERHALLESFRTLRSSIVFLPVEGARPKTLLVTSAQPGEGKTTVAANLAITFAFSGAKTLLVDADLRRGRMHDLFHVNPDAGFSKVLQQRIPWREAIIQTSFSNLSLLPRGRSLAHPAEHLMGKVADQFLQDVYKEFDYIIFDSAPALVADDTLSFAPKIDGTLFVIRFSTSSARLSRRAIELLTNRQVNLLGIIANDVKLSESEYGYGYRYYYGTREEKEVEANV